VPGLEASDFWWLPGEADLASLRVGVGHHRPKADNDDPALLEWRCPVDDVEIQVRGNPCLHPLAALRDARRACHNTNIYRTLQVFGRARIEFLGPFILDVDNESRDNGYSQDLDDAFRVTKEAVTLLLSEYRLTEPDIRVFFSGCKGFNIEVRPEALDIDGDVRQQVKEASRWWNRINQDLHRSQVLSDDYATSIDRVYWESGDLKHPYLRLHASVNSWVASTGAATNRLKIEVDVDKLSSVSMHNISRRAEGLANNDI
jgi:hypothetical protein